VAVSTERRDNSRRLLSDDAVEAFFDRALDEGSREQFFASLRADLPRCEQVARTQRVLSKLREPVQCPDFTDVILSRVARRRGFLPPALRKLVTVGRALVAASVLLGLFAVAMIQRYAPRMTEWTPASRPVTELIDSGCQGATVGAGALAGSLNAMKTEAAPVMQLGALAMSRAADPTGSSKTARLPWVGLGGVSPGPLQTVRILSADSVGGSLALRSGSGPDRISQGMLLDVSPLGGLPTPNTGRWVWAAGPGRSLQDSLFLFPSSLDPSANLLWPSVDPLLVETGRRTITSRPH
jgi:hypothetical protein